MGIDGGKGCRGRLPRNFVLEASEEAGPRVERVAAVQVWSEGELERLVGKNSVSPTCHGCDVAVLVDLRNAVTRAVEQGDRWTLL